VAGRVGGWPGGWMGGAGGHQRLLAERRDARG
jgi:hypothetical protein